MRPEIDLVKIIEQVLFYTKRSNSTSFRYYHLIKISKDEGA